MFSEKRVAKIIHLVCSEAVVQFHNADLVPTLAFLEPRLSKYLIGTVLRHRISHNVHRTTGLERGRVVGSHCVRHDFDGLVLEPVFTHKFFRCDDATCRAVLEE